MTLSMTYGDALPGIDATGLVNGDGSLYGITGRSNSTSGNINASGSPYGITSNLGALGYNISGPTSGTLAVAQKALTLSGVTVANRAYDGTVAATVSNTGSLSGTLLSDVVSVDGVEANFDSQNAGLSKIVTLSGITLTGTDSANYSVTSPVSSTADISRANISVTTAAVTKTYDGNLSAAGTAGTDRRHAVQQRRHRYPGQHFRRDVCVCRQECGRWQTVMVSGVTVNDGNSGNNYSVTYVDNTASIIDKAALTVSNTSVANKVYDGNTAATLINGALAGVVSGETVTLTQTGSFADKNVGSAKVVTAATAIGGTDADNYTVTQPAGLSADITAKTLTISGLVANNKTYDASSTATVTNWGTVDTGISGEALTLNHGAASFDNANAGIGKTVTANGYSLADGSGGAASNYQLSASSATTTANIAAKQLTLVASKVYDGTTSLAGIVTFNGLEGSETLTYTGATASNAHVATAGKYIDAITLADGTNGGMSNNYVLPALDVANAPVTISAATLTPTLTNTGVTKTYDGTANVPADFAPAWSFAGLVSGDTAASLASTATAYNSKDVASADKLTVSGLSVSGITGSNASQASDYVLNATSQDVAATIVKAALTVTANNDAKFVTQTDAAGYAGVTYFGFVGGETSAVLGGIPSISRSNAANNAAGVYAGVLQASSLSSDNYAITYANGDYTVVPSNQLLVRVSNASTLYGTTAGYAIASAAYWDPAANAGGGGEVVLGAATVNGNNNFTLDDGAGGTATFTLAPAAALTSGAGFIKAGAYQLSTSGTVSENSGNFSDTLTIVGSHTIGQKSVAASAPTGFSKTYDGNTSMSNVNVGLGGLEAGDAVTVSGLGAFANRNAGTSKAYTISTLALAGNDAANYFLVSGSGFSGTNGSISAKAVTLDPPAVTRIYNGGTDHTTSAADLTYLSGLLGVVGDSVSAATLAFNTKDVGTGKTLAATAVSIDDGNDGNNYSVTLGANSASAVTRLDSVTWVGGATGNWFDPTNWAGGAVPDRANVANVVIPQGVVVSFTTSGAVAPADGAAPVNLESLGSAGGLAQSDGSLNVGAGGILLASLSQTGGTLNNAGTTVVDSFSQTGGSTTLSGNLTVAQDFNQSGSGNVAVGGATQITDTRGGVQLGNLNTLGGLSVVSSDGPIGQAPDTALSVEGTASFTASQGGNPAVIVLANAGNDFLGLVNLSGSQVAINDANALTLGTVTTSGDLAVQSHGALNLGASTVGGNLSASSGNGNISQSGPLAVNGKSTLAAGTGNIVLGNPGNRLPQGVAVTAASSSINGDAQANLRTLVGRVIGALPVASLPGVNAYGPELPPPLTMAVADTATVPSRAGNSSGVIVALVDQRSAEGVPLVAVSLPKGASAVGFGFALPTDVRGLLAKSALVQASLPDGAALPGWFRFDAPALRFDASAAPSGAIPMELLLSEGDRHVRIVISERNE